MAVKRAGSDGTDYFHAKQSIVDFVSLLPCRYIVVAQTFDTETHNNSETKIGTKKKLEIELRLESNRSCSTCQVDGKARRKASDTYCSCLTIWLTLWLIGLVKRCKDFPLNHSITAGVGKTCCHPFNKSII